MLYIFGSELKHLPPDEPPDDYLFAVEIHHYNLTIRLSVHNHVDVGMRVIDRVFELILLALSSQFGLDPYYMLLMACVESQRDIFVVIPLSQHEQVGKGHESNVLIGEGRLLFEVGMVQPDESRRGVGSDQLADAEVVVGQICYFCVVVDAENRRGDGHRLDYAEVIAHLVVILIRLL
jgi:hypothetical protein